MGFSFYILFTYTSLRTFSREGHYDVLDIAEEIEYLLEGGGGDPAPLFVLVENLDVFNEIFSPPKF